MLGTFITEWDAGKTACGRLFSSEAAAECCAHQLAAIAAWHGFEGWLINIENELDLEMIPHLLTFLRLTCLQPACIVLPCYDVSVCCRVRRLTITLVLQVSDGTPA